MHPVAKFAAFCLLCGWALVVLLPIYWLAVTSVKTPYQVDKGPFYIPFVDFQPTLDPGATSWSSSATTRSGRTSTRSSSAPRARSSRCILGSSAAYALVRFRYSPRFGIIGLFIGCLAFALIATAHRGALRRSPRPPRSASS